MLRLVRPTITKLNLLRSLSSGVRLSASSYSISKSPQSTDEASLLASKFKHDIEVLKPYFRPDSAELDINPSVEDSAFPEKYFLAEKAARDAGIVLEKKVLSGSNVMDIVKMLEDEGMDDITVLDVRTKCDWTSWMIIATGKSVRHMSGVVDDIYKAFKSFIKDNRDESGLQSASDNVYPIVEGRDSEDWILVDCGDVVLHLFMPEARSMYDLESLWGNIPENVTAVQTMAGNVRKGLDEYDPKFKKRPPLPI